MNAYVKAAQRFIEQITPLRFFVVVASIFGIALALLVPPFQGSDEPLHFYRSYDVSEMNLVVDRNVGDDSGGILPLSLMETVRVTTNGSSLGNLRTDEKYDMARTRDALTIAPAADQREWVNFTATALYPPVAYIPQAIGVLIARIFDAPPLVMMYMGRLANLAAWIGFFALAIKLIPARKWAVVFVGLLPVALAQAASLSADVVTTGSFAVFLAGVLYLMARKNPATRLELGTLLGIASVMVLCKQLMIVMLPLILLIPNKVLGREKRDAYITKAVIIGVPVLLYGAWSYIIRGLDMKSVFAARQNPSEQIHLVLQDPFTFITAFWNTHFSTFGNSIAHSFMGTFGWGDPSLPEWIVIAGYVGLFLVFVANSSAKRVINHMMTGRQKIFAGIMALAFFGAVSAALYAYYNPVGASKIAGIQGRYLFPLALLLIPLVQSNWLRVSNRAYRNIAIMTPLTLLLASLITICARYYV